MAGLAQDESCEVKRRHLRFEPFIIALALWHWTLPPYDYLPSSHPSQKSLFAFLRIAARLQEDGTVEILHLTY